MNNGCEWRTTMCRVESCSICTGLKLTVKYNDAWDQSLAAWSVESLVNTPANVPVWSVYLLFSLQIMDIFLFETRIGDEKDDNNSLQRFGVLHLLQREIVKRIRSWLFTFSLLFTISLWRRCNTPKRWRLLLSSFSSPVRVSNKNISWNMRVRCKKPLAKLNSLADYAVRILCFFFWLIFVEEQQYNTY